MVGKGKSPDTSTGVGDSWQPSTGLRDMNSRAWYGLTFLEFFLGGGSLVAKSLSLSAIQPLPAQTSADRAFV